MRTIETFLILCVVCVHCNGTVVERIHNMFSRDMRSMNQFVTLQNVSLIRCCGVCMTYTECGYVNYNKELCTCELASASNTVLNTDVGWSVYTLSNGQTLCPYNINDFTSVGTYSIALCSTKLTQGEAALACARFGRLVKLDTQPKMDEIMQYLSDVSAGGGFSDMWVDGRKETKISTWQFTDNTPMPTHLNFYMKNNQTKTYPACGRMKTPLEWNDKPCSNEFKYICEKL